VYFIIKKLKFQIIYSPNNIFTKYKMSIFKSSFLKVKSFIFKRFNRVKDQDEKSEWDKDDNELVQQQEYNDEYDSVHIKEIELPKYEPIFSTSKFNMFIKFKDYIEYIRENHEEFFHYYRPTISTIHAHSRSYACLKVGDHRERYYYNNQEWEADLRCENYEKEFNRTVKYLVECSLNELNIIYVYTLNDIMRYGETRIYDNYLLY
jgi:hypothetical protein